MSQSIKQVTGFDRPGSVNRMELINDKPIHPSDYITRHCHANILVSTGHENNIAQPVFQHSTVVLSAVL